MRCRFPGRAVGLVHRAGQEATRAMMVLSLHNAEQEHQGGGDT